MTEFDASAGGVGGCPFALSATGNLAIQDLVKMLSGLGIETGVDLPALTGTSRWPAGHLGRTSSSRVVTALRPPRRIGVSNYLEVWGDTVDSRH